MSAVRTFLAHLGSPFRRAAPFLATHQADLAIDVTAGGTSFCLRLQAADIVWKGMVLPMKTEVKRCWRRLWTWVIGTGVAGGLVLMFFDEIPPAGLKMAGVAYLVGMIIVRVRAKQLSRAMENERIERGLTPGMTFVRTMLLVLFTGLTTLLITVTFLLTKIEVFRVA